MKIVRTAVTAYVALGANLGDAATTVLQAVEDIAGLSGTAVLRRSSLYRTAPIDSGGPDYINAVVEISTLLAAPILLKQLQKLERLAGRERPYLNAPRTLDLDILMYGQSRIQSPLMTVPHPRMTQRAFVLRPLAEIASSMVHEDWLQLVSDQKVKRVP